MIHIKRLLAARPTAAVLVLLAAVARAQPAPQPKLPTVPLSAGMHLITAEIARTPQQQQKGLMFRSAVPGNAGMLFVNDEPELRCFWMHDTLVPLTIAFIADDGTIVNLADMAPQTDTSHCSMRPVRFALEMRQGWFEERGIRAGFKLRGAPFEK
jgi:uncharacterized membrane protein (UPF0127 family)